MKKLLFTIIFILIAFVFWSQIDDPLSPEAEALIARVDTAGDSKAYLYLSGIFAHETENPVDVGRALLAESRKQEADDDYESVEYPDDRKLALPEGEAFCRLSDKDCLLSLFSLAGDINGLLDEHALLISRANTFLAFTEYKNLTLPSYSEVIPPYQYLTKAERLKVLNAIALYQNDEPQKAVDTLLDQFAKQRQALALQDNLIGKMVFLAKLSETLDVLSIILSKTDIKVAELATLNASERNLSQVAAREFALPYHIFKQLDKSPEIFEMDGNVPSWISRLFFKANMTLNAITPRYYRLERLVQLQPAQFAQEMDDGAYTPPTTSKLRNPMGDMLISTGADFEIYVARFIDLEVKITLFNHVHHAGKPIHDMQNPYYADKKIEERDGRACFHGPFEDERFMRCLLLKH